MLDFILLSEEVSAYAFHKLRAKISNMPYVIAGTHIKLPRIFIL